MKKIKLLSLILSLFIILGCDHGTTPPPSDENLVSWMEVPSLKEAYAGKIDYIGMSVQWNWPVAEYATTKIQSGLQRHFNSITMGNEMKPDEFLGTYTVKEPKSFEDFTDSYGTIVKVPKNHLQFGVVDQCLNASKNIDGLFDFNNTFFRN